MTMDNKEVLNERVSIRVAGEQMKLIMALRTRESKRIGIELSEAAIVRKALELGLAQMERVK